MYYIGTEAECQAYNDEVTQGSNYDMVNCLRWADIVEHKDGALFAIKAHPNFPSELTQLEQFTEDWFDAEQ